MQLKFYFYSLATKDVLHYGEQSEELAELKRMVSLLIKRDTATRDNHKPEGINFPLESEEALKALEEALLDRDVAKALVSVIHCTNTCFLIISQFHLSVVRETK